VGIQPVFGGLVVLADNGGVRTEVALENVLKLNKDEILSVRKEEMRRLKSGEYSNESLLAKFATSFPVTSTISEMKFEGRDFIEVKQEVFRPLVLLGDGYRSRNWLKRNARTLKEMGAFLIVIKAEEQESVLQLSKIYGESLKVMKDSDPVIMKYQVPGLPALITKDGVYQ
jgi:hypothetical protein